MTGGLFGVDRWQEQRTIAEASLGPEHFEVLPILGDFATLLKESGEFDAAPPCSSEHCRPHLGVYGPNDPNTVISLGNLADNHYLRGDLGPARALLERALAIIDRAANPAAYNPEIILWGLGQIALDEHRPGDAVALLERGLSEQRRQEGRGALPGLLFALAQALRQVAQDLPRALDLAREAAVIFRGDGEISTSTLAETERWLAEAGAAPVPPTK